jgi:hypothetical protein
MKKAWKNWNIIKMDEIHVWRICRIYEYRIEFRDFGRFSQVQPLDKRAVSQGQVTLPRGSLGIKKTCLRAILAVASRNVRGGGGGVGGSAKGNPHSC